MKININKLLEKHYALDTDGEGEKLLEKSILNENKNK